MVGSALLDTNILIDYLNGVPRARSELRRRGNNAISIVTWMEVMAGATSEDESTIRQFLLTFRCVPITDAIAERAVSLRRERRLKLPDAIILATAQIEDRILVTRNTRDFSGSDPGIKIPYSINVTH